MKTKMVSDKRSLISFFQNKNGGSENYLLACMQLVEPEVSSRTYFSLGLPWNGWFRWMAGVLSRRKSLVTLFIDYSFFSEHVCSLLPRWQLTWSSRSVSSETSWWMAIPSHTKHETYSMYLNPWKFNLSFLICRAVLEDFLFHIISVLVW